MQATNSGPQARLPSIQELGLGQNHHIQTDNPHFPSQPPWPPRSAGFHRSPSITLYEATPSTLESGPYSASLSLNHELNGFRLHPRYAYPSPPASHRGNVSNESVTVSTPASTTASPRFGHAQINSESLQYRSNDELSPRVANSDRQNAPSRQRTRSGRITKTNPDGKSTTSRAKKSDMLPKKLKDKDEQKRRCNESEKLKTTELALIRRGYRHTQGLGIQNQKVSGLDYNKSETSEEANLDAEELENPQSADLRHVARLRKLMYRMEEGVQLLITDEKVPTQSRHQREQRASNIQKILPGRYLHLVGIEVSDVKDEVVAHFRNQSSAVTCRFKLSIEDRLKKSFDDSLPQLSDDKLNDLIHRLEQILKEEMKMWARQEANLRLRIFRLKLELSAAERGLSVVNRTRIQQQFKPLLSKEISRVELWELARSAPRIETGPVVRLWAISQRPKDFKRSPESEPTPCPSPLATSSTFRERARL